MIVKANDLAGSFGEWIEIVCGRDSSSEVVVSSWRVYILLGLLLDGWVLWCTERYEEMAKSWRYRQGARRLACSLVILPVLADLTQ